MFTVRVIDITKNHMQDMPVHISGWVRSIRTMGSVSFISLGDQSCLQPLQVVVDNELLSETTGAIKTGSSVSVEGTVMASPAKGQLYELRADTVQLLGASDDNYPLQKKRHSFEFLRTIPHLRVRSNTFSTIMRIRHAALMAIHRFCDEEQFIYVQTPIITQADAEGAGELFQVVHKKNEDFFGAPSYLTVSGQLAAEAMACSLGRVYTLGPTFRAENSNTSRHLSEFWMLELEAAFVNLFDNHTIAERLIKYVICTLLDNHQEDMEFFSRYIKKNHIDELQNIANTPFERIEYSDAITLLSKAKRSFEFKPTWGIDLQSEHERYLTEELFKKPVVVTNYPKGIKAFYMRMNDDEKTVAAVDILLPAFGEIVGGSQREERLDVLIKRMKECGIDQQEYGWYLDLRRYGSVEHSGFGLGIERFIQCITGMANIRDVIPFPRSVGQAFA